LNGFQNGTFCVNLFYNFPASKENCRIFRRQFSFDARMKRPRQNGAGSMRAFLLHGSMILIRPASEGFSSPSPMMPLCTLMQEATALISENDVPCGRSSEYERASLW
ncbi:hypothetical protein, partial [uncultured Selenomonas sp.]|uniref:hypothetical protein n=1 Tax=uncultured Selenomonas sp. TaxID=159275 RepID=UPI0028DD3D17